MSKQFTYQLNENKLRQQLKGSMAAYNEDAWHKYQSYADSKEELSRGQRLQSFQIPLNRNVVLPAVFGAIIILFSFLLVNFVNFKDSPKENQQQADLETKTPEVIPEAQLPEKPKPQPKLVAPATTHKIEKDSVVHEEPIKQAVAKQQTESKNDIIAVQEPVASESVVPSVENADTVSAEELRAKRRAKRRAQAADTQKLDEIRPTPILEEGEAEIRPDQSN